MSARFFCACILVASWSACLYSQVQSPYAEPVTIEHGLSQGMIFDVCQTRDGFLWIATKDGLNRYDGYHFKIFNHDPFNPYSLAENTVTALFEDSRGWLWVGTDRRGVELFDRRSGRFYHFPLSFQRNDKGSSFEVYRIAEASNGDIYLLQKGNGLVRVAVPAAWRTGLPDEPNLGNQTQVTLFPTEQFRFPDSNGGEEVLVAIQPQSDGAVWVYSEKGRYRVEPDKGFVRPMPVGAGAHETDDIWGTTPLGVVRFRHHRAAILDMPQGLKVYWTMTKPAANGGYWVGINQHIWHLAPGEELDFSNPDWEVDANVSTALTDRNGNIWVGTQGYGLRKINPRKQPFNKGAEGTSIWGLWRDRHGKYFCKVVNAVFPYDPVTRQIGAQHAFPDGPKRVLDMIYASDGACWLLGRGDAENGMAVLQRLDPAGGAAQTFEFSFNPFLYARLLQDRSGALWAAGLNCQLVRFHPPTARFEHFDYSHLFGSEASTVRAFALAEDGNGHLWVGTQMGLVQGVPNGDSLDFRLLQTDLANPQGLNNNSIACLLPDPENPAAALWVGTKGGGINRIDLRSGRVKHITTTDGLPDNVVYGILAPTKGEFWCSTNRGLAKITPQAGGGYRITAITVAQGLQDNEFNTQAFFLADDGEMLFGGVNGLNRFYADAVKFDTTPPPVFIVGLRINHLPVDYGKPDSPLNAPLETLQTIRLDYTQNTLSFEFAVLAFTDPAKNRYRYRLVGANSDWVELGTHRYAEFTQLAPGTYTLLVQGNNGEGAWQDAANPIAITILPPWWRSTPAWLAYALLLAWAGWQAYRFQLRRVQLREQLAFEHRETERIKALEQMKTNFFSNVTHEFRTPLTLILEPARRILAQANDPDIRENARHIEANSQRMLTLVNQLLDMAKLEDGSMGLDLRLGNFAATVRNAYRAFLPLAEKRGVEMHLEIAPELPPFLFDAHKTEIVLNNLLSNALKFTPAGGAVRVQVEQQQAAVLVRVADTGIGIPAGLLDKVFDRFYQVDDTLTRQSEGTGIGLALSKELAEAMRGSISVDSQPGQGSVFSFRLPVQAVPADVPTQQPAPAFRQAEAPVDEDAKPARAADTAEQALVLLIEDNVELRTFIRQCIGASWQVVEASDGEEGVRKAVELVPDLVISDLMMPLKDGYAVCDDLKNNEITAHIPVILLTAKATLDAKLKGLRTGADDYLTKPFHSEELLARMENLVEQRRRLRRRYGQILSPIAESAAEAETLLAPPDREFLRRVAALVEQYLSDETFGVEELAQQMHLSRVQLYRKVKAITDQNVTDWMRHYRLDRAMSMLRNREGLVYEVAARVGFGSEKYFSRAFKEKFGMPPSQVTQHPDTPR